MVIGTHAELIHLDRTVCAETKDSAEQIIGTVAVTRELLRRLTSLGRSDAGRVERLALAGPTRLARAILARDLADQHRASGPGTD